MANFSSAQVSPRSFCFIGKSADSCLNDLGTAPDILPSRFGEPRGPISLSAVFPQRVPCAPMMGPYERSRHTYWKMTLFVCIIFISSKNMYSRCASCATTERCVKRKNYPYPPFSSLRTVKRPHARYGPYRVPTSISYSTIICCV